MYARAGGESSEIVDSALGAAEDGLMGERGEPGRVFVVRPGALGDGVATLPVLESLAAGAPGARVGVVGPPVFRLAVECGLASEHLAFDDARLLGLFAEGGSSAVFGDCALCILYGREADAQLAASLRRSGVARALFWPSWPEPGRHIVDHLLGAAEAAGFGAATRVPRLVPRAAWFEAARAFLASAGIRDEFAAIHPGSGGRAKRWPAERFVELAARLGRPVVWLLGPAESEEGRLRAMGRGIGVVAEGLPLPTLAGLLASCQVYVGNDSGVSHLAAAVGAPTVALFGPTDPAVWAPRGPRVEILGGPGEGGWGAVTVDRVAAAARELAR